jgi:lipoprotein-releasing system permease protein
MFHPLSVYVGLRYVRARSHTFFVSFITWASLVGVCVGVAALIVILSVMNGFESELRERLLSLSAQVRVTAAPAASGGVAVTTRAEWQSAARAIAGAPGVTAVACCRCCCGASTRRPRAA